MGTPDPCYYSLSWAKEVIRRMREKHARATDLFEEFFVVTDNQLAVALAKRDPVYNECRETIKRYSNYLERGWKGPTDDGEIATERWYLQRKGYERLVNRLDKLGKRPIMKEQGSGEGRSELKASDILSLAFFCQGGPYACV